MPSWIRTQPRDRDVATSDHVRGLATIERCVVGGCRSGLTTVWATSYGEDVRETRLGQDVALPITESAAYDLILDCDEGLERVQVRFTSSSRGQVDRRTTLMDADQGSALGGARSICIEPEEWPSGLRQLI